MSMTRRLAVIGACALGLACGEAAAKDWRKLRIGVEGAYPPFSEMTPDGRLYGFDIDIADALCREIRAECEFVQREWSTIIADLLAHSYDAIVASMSITDERKQRLAFTKKYYQMPARFVRRKGSGIEITPTALKGRTVGVQRATIFDSFLTDRYGETVIIRRYTTLDEASFALQAGQIDLLIADSRAVHDNLLSTPSGANYEFVGPPFSERYWFGEGNAIAVRKEDTDLKALLDQALDRIRANGTYDMIVRRYFSYDIYGSPPPSVAGLPADVRSLPTPAARSKRCSTSSRETRAC